MFSSLAILVGCIGTINTYKCYVCSSAIQASCGDPFNVNARTAANKVEANAGEVCVVCLF
jgi:hypothetical protein